MATYGSIAGVESLTPTVGNYTTSSTPTINEISQWIIEGSAQIDRKLAQNGYAVPVAVTAMVFPELRALNNKYVQINVVRSRGLSDIQGTEQNVAEELLVEFNNTLSDLVGGDLTTVGVERAQSTTTRRRRVKSLQMRRVDGYSGQYANETNTYENVSE